LFNIILQAVTTIKSPKVKKFIRQYRRQSAPCLPGVQKKRQALRTETITKFDVYDSCGLYEDDFETIFQRLQPQLARPYYGGQTCTRVLSGRVSLLLTLFFLRNKPRYKVVASMFGVHRSTVSRVLYHTIPLLATSIRTIKWPHSWDVNVYPVGIEGSQFAIDGTAHYRNRVHPGQRVWYRGDKKCHFMAAQVVVALNGEILAVHLAKGHNNDQGLFNITVRKIIEQDNVVGLADRGYTHNLLVSPDDVESSLRVLQSGTRTIVEIVIGMAKVWEYAAGRVSHPPELQALGLRVIYELTNMLLLQFPTSHK